MLEPVSIDWIGSILRELYLSLPHEKARKLVGSRSVCGVLQFYFMSCSQPPDRVLTRAHHRYWIRALKDLRASLPLLLERSIGGLAF